MLSMLEEVVLLAVDERTGKLRSTEGFGTGYALAGAVFFDLALAKRIDTDTSDVSILDTTPTGDIVCDQVLGEMVAHPELKTVRDWIEALVRRHVEFENAALASLIDRGILLHEKTTRLWIINVERFPVVDSKQQHHVKFRLAQAIMTDEIPDTRDIMLVSIAEACRLMHFVLSMEELENRRERIQLLCTLETISREVREAILTLDENIQSAMTRIV